MLRSKRRTRLLFSSLALLLVLVLLAACGNKNEGGEEPGAGEGADPGEVVATYEGGEITRDEFDKFIDTVSFFNAQFATVRDLPEFQEYILQQMAALEIMHSEASEESKAGAEEEVNQQLEEIKGFFAAQGGEEAFQEQLDQLGITEEDVRSYIEKSFIVMSDLESKVTEEEVQEYYDELNTQHLLDVVTVSHVLVALKNPQDGSDLRTKEEALERANEVKEKLDGGADFAEIAQQYSDDPGSKDSGGTYADEVLGQSMWVPEFKQAAQDLPIDTISEPVETQHGYHVMRVDERAPQPLEEVSDQIRDAITSEKIGQFIAEELPNYNFENLLPPPEEAPEGEEPGESPEGAPEGEGQEESPEGTPEGEGQEEAPEETAEGGEEEAPGAQQ